MTTYHQDNGVTPPPWPPQPGPQRPAYPPPPAPSRKSWPRRHKVLTGVLAIAGLTIIGTFVGVSGSGSPAPAPTVSTPSVNQPAASASQAPASQAPTSQPPATHAATPAKADYTVSLKVTSKECFGEAGCNITWEPRLHYTGPDIPDSDSYDITFVVRGGDDSDQIETLTTTGRHYSPDQYMTSTRSSAVKLIATVTDVSPA